MKRLFKILAFIAVIYGVAIYGGFTPMPLKVTDPSDPRFNINRFRFEDYPSEDDLRNTLQKIFPVGTDMAEVERVLVKIGGANKLYKAKIDIHRAPLYSDPKNYSAYYSHKNTLRSRALNIGPLPGRSDRVIYLEVDRDNKITFIKSVR